MATRTDLVAALKKADAAGDTDAATQLAVALRAMESDKAAPADSPKEEKARLPKRGFWDTVTESLAAAGPAMAGGQQDPGMASMATSPKTLQEAMAESRGRLQGAATGARYGIPLAQPQGGAGGYIAGDLGEKVAQFLESGKITDMGASTASGAVNSIPFGKPAKGLIEGGKMLLKSVGAGAAAPQIRSLVNDLKLAPAGESGVGAAIGAGSPVLAKVVGAIAGKVMNHVSPEDMAKAVSLMKNSEQKAAALAAGKRQDMKVIPSMVSRGNMVTDVLESVGGMGATQRAFRESNDAAATQAMKKHAGVPATESLSKNALDAAEAPHAAVYEQLRADGDQGRAVEAQIKKEIGVSSDPHLQAATEESRALEMQAAKLQAGVDIEAWKAARKEAGRLQSAPYYTQDPKAIAAAKETVAVLEQRIADYAVAAGEPGMLKELEAARRGFAKVNDTRRVMNYPGDSVDTTKVGRAYKKNPGQMTGEGADVGQFANQYKDVVGTGGNRMDPGNSGTNAAGVIGLLMAKKPIAAAASLLNPREWARQLLLSDFVQDRVKYSAKPRTSADPAVVLALMRELSLMNANRGKKDDDLGSLMRQASIQAALQQQQEGN